MNNTITHTKMNNYQNKNVVDYRFKFSPISNNNGSISFIDNSQNQEQSIGFNINDKALKYRVKKELPSLIADLIDFAVAIYACDRLLPLTSDNLNKNQRRLFVTLPVRHPELFIAFPKLVRYTYFSSLLPLAFCLLPKTHNFCTSAD
jgi:hypothetical protein